MTTAEIQHELTEAAEGSSCSQVETFSSHTWRFTFSGGLVLDVTCPWRITNEDGIVLGSEDDGQMFGLPSPVEGQAEALKLLSASPLKSVLLTGRTGDFSLKFESGLQLEIFNDSSGYEGWNCSTNSGLNVIGMGGGAIVSFSNVEKL
ncbi:hypothetical protein [Silvibacterium sp.]|uniref:hypothetical protein n=1 Tax=Silvibacterium sp. TaxID=1964179 RepID=UPI0039E686EE